MADENPAIPGRGMIRVTAILLGLWGLYQVLAGLYFLLLRPTFLPEDLRASSTTLESVRAVVPGIEVWLDWVFAVLGGQMVAVGALALGGAMGIWRGRRPNRIDVGAFAVAGVFSVALMSGVNFAIESDFRWLLTAPVVIWLTACACLRRLAS